MSKERLDKILSNNGMGTRKTVRPLVWRGHVSVNGQVATNPDQKVDVETDVIEVDGKQLVKVVAWYDNEMGYSAQMVRTAKKLVL